MGISICPNCKALVKNNNHLCEVDEQESKTPQQEAYSKNIWSVYVAYNIYKERYIGYTTTLDKVKLQLAEGRYFTTSINFKDLKFNITHSIFVGDFIEAHKFKRWLQPKEVIDNLFTDKILSDFKTNYIKYIKDTPFIKRIRSERSTRSEQSSRGVEAGGKESQLEQKKEIFKDQSSIPPEETKPGEQKPIPKSAVPGKTVRVRSANLLNAGSLATNIVVDGSEERLACVFDSEFFVKRFIQNKNLLRKPTTQEDFKAIIYSCGGPVPSMIAKTETKPDESGNWVCVMWRMK